MNIQNKSPWEDYKVQVTLIDDRSSQVAKKILIAINLGLAPIAIGAHLNSFLLEAIGLVLGVWLIRTFWRAQDPHSQEFTSIPHAIAHLKKMQREEALHGKDYQ